MPLLTIKSLPFAQEVNIPVALGELSKQLSNSCHIPLNHVMVAWEYLSPNHFAHHGRVSNCQPHDTHPVIVHLVAPNFNTEEQISEMLEVIASSLAEQLPIDKSNIFITFSPAYSDGVYDEGHVVEWE